MEKEIVVVTGASGWLGKSVVSVFENDFPNYRVIALSRTKDLNKGHNDLIYMSYDEFLSDNSEITGLVHTAFITKNYIDEIGPSKYVDQNTKIHEWLMNFIKSKDPKWTVAVSSGATRQYLDKVKAGLPIFGSDLYGKMKLEEEEALLGSDIPNVAIGRLWAASGRYMKNHKIYALGQFIESAINGKNIKIDSREPVFRRYMDAEDFMKVLVMAALDSNRTLFDSGGVLITIENLAQKVSQFFNNKNNSKIEIEYDTKVLSIDNAKYFTNSEKFLELQLKFKIKERSITEQIDRTSGAIMAKIGNR